MGKASKQFRAVGMAATAMGAILVGVAAIGVKASSDFESSFAGVRKTVDATEAQFAELATGFKNLSKEIPVNVNELNRIGEAAGQLGIKRENIISFTKTIAMLGATSNIAGDEAATQLARIAAVTGLSQTEFDRLASSIVELGNNFETTEAEIVEFTLRIAGAGKVAGLTEAQMLAIGAAMTSVGIKAEAGGTAVQKALIAMNEAVINGNEDMTVFARTAGIAAEDFGAAWEADAGEVFTRFVEGLEASGDDMVSILKEVGLGNERSIRSFLSLAGAGDKLRDAMETSTGAFAENTALAKEFEERLKTFASQVQIAKNRLGLLAITVGDNLIPILKDLLSFVGPIIETISKWIEKNEEFTKNIIIAVAAIGALLLVVGPLLIALPLIAAGIVLVTGAAGPWILMFLAVIAIVAGVSVAVFLLRKHWDTIWSKIMEITETAVNFIIGLINKMTSVHRHAFAAMADAIAVVAAALGQDGLAGKMREVASALREGLKDIDLTTEAIKKTGEAATVTAVAVEAGAQAEIAALEGKLKVAKEVADEQRDVVVKAAQEANKQILNNAAKSDAERALQRTLANNASLSGQRQFLNDLGIAERESAQERIEIIADLARERVSIEEKAAADAVAANQKIADSVSALIKQIQFENTEAGKMGLTIKDVAGHFFNATGDVDALTKALKFVELVGGDANTLIKALGLSFEEFGNQAQAAGNKAAIAISQAELNANAGSLRAADLETRRINDMIATNVSRGLPPAGFGTTVGDFAHGGVVGGPIGAPQLAIVHGGERVIPNGGGGGSKVLHLTVNMNAPSFESRNTIAKAWRDIANEGGFSEFLES